uniref:C2 domain-containing protein n=1 Tax=Rhodnius prolixus TaxID=13249 RepID=T1HPR1_RHOPR
MPGKLKVKIIAGRNLPVMDRGSDTTDAFVEIKLGTTTYKTDVCRKTLNPQWNSEWYKFEMEDSELQDEPLQIRLMDYDTYSANDAIGKVYLNLNPLLLPSFSSSYVDFRITINGWLPVYDTMHGIRGEVSIIVKLELFEDFNRFRQSSCGVHFFSISYYNPNEWFHGFVEELVYADDPEYQWFDKIRTPRSTNEARQTLFFKLNGEVKRKIGLKVLDLGANAVVGYKQCFDLEGECGVVVRALGTAVTLEHVASQEFLLNSYLCINKYLRISEVRGTFVTYAVIICRTQTDEPKREVSPICRRSSDSDISIAQRDICDDYSKILRKIVFAISKHWNFCFTFFAFVKKMPYYRLLYYIWNDSSRNLFIGFRRPTLADSLQELRIALAEEYENIFQEIIQNPIRHYFKKSCNSLEIVHDSMLKLTYLATNFTSNKFNLRNEVINFSENIFFYNYSFFVLFEDNFSVHKSKQSIFSVQTEGCRNILCFQRPIANEAQHIYLKHMITSNFISSLTLIHNCTYQSANTETNKIIKNTSTSVLRFLRSTKNTRKTQIIFDIKYLTSVCLILICPTVNPCAQDVSESGNKNRPLAKNYKKLRQRKSERKNVMSQLYNIISGNSLSISDKSGRPPHLLSTSIPPPIKLPETLEMGEYPFLTMTKYPPGFIQHIGGVVSARAVKLLISDFEGTETRDSWWTELRLEIRSHARALSCNAVIAYSEQTTVCEDVCILSASGTAAIINFSKSYPFKYFNKWLFIPATLKNHMDTSFYAMTNFDFVQTFLFRKQKYRESKDNGCKVYHVPYNEISHPFRMKLAKCAQCKKGKVGELLMTTADLPPGVSVKASKGSLIEAVVCRHKRDCKGELNAKEVSDALPFLEYELHTQLVHRLSAVGANAIVGLKVELCLGERVLVGHATGTGITLTSLPIPLSPAENVSLSIVHPRYLRAVRKEKYTGDNECDEGQVELREMRKYDVNSSDEDDWEEQVRELDLSSGNKDTCVLEVTGEPCAGPPGTLPSGIPPEGFLISTTQDVPGAPVANLTIVRNLQMFTQIWKARMCPLPSSSTISNQFHRLLQGVYFKLRGMTPCALANVCFKIEVPQQDDLLISVVGMAVGLAEIDKKNNQQCNNDGKKQLSFFNEFLNRSHIQKLKQSLSAPVSEQEESSSKGTPIFRPARKSIHTPPREQRYGVDVTPLCYVPGAKIVSYLGNLNFFFIRESSCIRESGGPSSFVHGFVAEVLAIVRAHVTAIGGNALTSYTMSRCHLTSNTHKNQ